MSRRLLLKNEDVILPDPFERGRTGKITLNVSADFNSLGFMAYDYDMNKPKDEYSEVVKTYSTIVIGGLEVTTENFIAPYRDKFGTNLSWANFDETIINQMNQDYEGKDNVSLDDFYKINGAYTSLYDYALSYRDKFTVYDEDRLNELSGWRLMASTDFQELMGLSPIVSNSRLENYINFLGCGLSDYHVPYSTDWDNMQNISGFSAVPLGRRESGIDGVIEEGKVIKWREYKKEAAFRLSDYSYGMFMFSLNNGVKFSDKLYHFGSARYVRTLTPKELGFDLWAGFHTDEILVLPFGSSPGYPYQPLRVGVLRGVAMRYLNKKHQIVLKSKSELQKEADLIMSDIKPF